jgi:hypothetical protein
VIDGFFPVIASAAKQSSALRRNHFVMAGLVPAIHVFLRLHGPEDVDARVKRGHDESQLGARWYQPAVVCSSR